MIKIKNKLSRKEVEEISILLQFLPDPYGEFFITRNNLRLYLKSNPSLLFKILAKGDYIAYDTEGKGIALITGWSDESKRKYVKVLVSDNRVVDKLLKAISWKIKIDLFCKLKKKNPLLKYFYNNNYVFFAGRGLEILLKRKPNKYFGIKRQEKDKEEIK